MSEKEIEQPICPDCGGDGVETCHNPDHGFLSGVMAVVGVNESACPCCGHNEDHKMKGVCETCEGLGIVAKKAYDSYLDEYVPEEDIEEVNEHCLKSTNL